MLTNERTAAAIIFANMHDSSIASLTKLRTFASVPFGGRYRMIDFPLSNCVNAKIVDVGLITKANYQSLMEHVGNGAEWDLSRKMGGLKIIPPYGNKNFGIYHGKLEALGAALDFMSKNPCKYILLSDCQLVANIDYNAIISKHKKSGADATVLYKTSFLENDQAKKSIILNFDENDRLKEVMLNPDISGEFNYSLNVFIFERDFLKELVIESISKGEYSLDKNFLQSKCKEYNIKGVKYNGYVKSICSMKNYYEANMELLDPSVREELFNKNRPIYTKVRDEAPVKYGLHADIKNSFIADGCIIDGHVENSVIFRGCRVLENASVKNSILMQRTTVKNGSNLQYVITDKMVEISKNKTLTSTSSYPTYIAKNTTV